MKRDGRLFKFLVLLIQYADDRDVGKFLANFIPEIINDSRKTFGMSYKEILLDSFYYPTLKQDKKIILHLRALTCNFYSYYFHSEYNKKKNLAKIEVFADDFIAIDTSDKLGKIINGYQGSIEDVNKISQIDKTSLEKCLKILINNYTKNHFYYEIYGDTITKITIADKIEEESYKLLDTETATSIVNEEKNLKINLHQHIKNTSCVELDIDSEPQNIKYFISINEKIVNALSKINRPCKLCLPIENKIKMRSLCNDCKLLLRNLKDLKQLTDSSIYKNYNFEKEISEIKLENNDYIKLRQDRKKLINKMLKIASSEILEETTTQFYELVKEIKNQIDSIFQT